MQTKTSTIDDLPRNVGDSEDKDILPGLLKQHPRFLYTISIGFAALFAELMLFMSMYYAPAKDSSFNIGLTVGTFLFSFLAIFGSFTLPHLYFLPRFKRSSPIIFLMMEWITGAIIVTAASIIQLVAGIFLVNGELFAISEHLRSLALYTLAICMMVHGAALFARYVRYLYERELHQSYKIVTVAGVTAVVLIILSLFLLPYDLGRIGTGLPNNGLLSLHITLRDIWLIVCTIFAFIWQLSVLADH